jgi:hypothetical protein
VTCKLAPPPWAVARSIKVKYARRCLLIMEIGRFRDHRSLNGEVLARPRNLYVHRGTPVRSINLPIDRHCMATWVRVAFGLGSFTGSESKCMPARMYSTSCNVVRWPRMCGSDRHRLVHAANCDRRVHACLGVLKLIYAQSCPSSVQSSFDEHFGTGTRIAEGDRRRRRTRFT